MPAFIPRSIQTHIANTRNMVKEYYRNNGGRYGSLHFCDACVSHQREGANCLLVKDAFPEDVPIMCNGCGRPVGNPLTSRGIEKISLAFKQKAKAGSVDGYVHLFMLKERYNLTIPGFDHWCARCGHDNGLTTHCELSIELDNDICHVQNCPVCLAARQCARCPRILCREHLTKCQYRMEPDTLCQALLCRPCLRDHREINGHNQRLDWRRQLDAAPPFPFDKDTL